MLILNLLNLGRTRLGHCHSSKGSSLCALSFMFRGINHGYQPDLMTLGTNYSAVRGPICKTPSASNRKRLLLYCISV